MALTPSSLLISTDVSSQIKSLRDQIAALQVQATRDAAAGPRSRPRPNNAPQISALQNQLALLVDPSLNPSITPGPNAAPQFASAKTGTKTGADSLQLINSLLIPGN